jgi:hypothetical protein
VETLAFVSFGAMPPYAVTIQLAREFALSPAFSVRAGLATKEKENHRQPPSGFTV